MDIFSRRMSPSKSGFRFIRRQSFGNQKTPVFHDGLIFQDRHAAAPLMWCLPHGITELAVEAGYGAVAYLLRYGQHRGFRRAKQGGGLPDPGDIQNLSGLVSMTAEKSLLK